MSVSWRHRLTVFCASFLLLLLGAGNALAEPVRNAVNAIDADILFMRHLFPPPRHPAGHHSFQRMVPVPRHRHRDGYWQGRAFCRAEFLF